ncbi:MAG: rhodanese-like domain-containing protein [Thermoanaerobaculia bacterium]|nr:hypothetical protein [Thermoanaerobaculia bacterium]MCK6682302.1 rhodanese-like domain-containing protein [Thermoanaerobaculia bacterium]
METMESTNWRRFFLETAALVVSAVLCALVANLMASRERKLALVTDYPNAQKVPERSAAPPPLSPVVAEAPAASPAAAAPVTAAPASPTFPPIEKGTSVPASSAAPAPDPAAKVKIIENRLSEDELLARFPPPAGKPYREATPEDVTTLFQSGALFIDARRTKVYQEGHIAGARSVSVWESDVAERILDLVNEGRRQDLPVVIYCSGGECEDSHMLSEKLFGAGFTNLVIYKDGWPDWVKRGGKTARGLTP